jgi:osmoprotectant transport system substrate-binding protein
MSFFSWAWDWITQAGNWHGAGDIPRQILAHLGYSGLPLLIAAVIAVPLGVAVGHTGRGAVAVVNLANIWRAIPTLGLLVLLVVLLGFSPMTWLLPLVVLAIPPILVNAYEGVAGVDRGVRDAARGAGMTAWQQVIRVEIPIALPLILVGLRTAAIFVVATATIAAYIGLGGLGRFIIDGLASDQYGPVAGGALLVVILAVLVLALFAVLSRLVVSPGLRRQERSELHYPKGMSHMPTKTRAVYGLAVLAAAAVAAVSACSSGSSSSSSSGSPSSGSGSNPLAQGGGSGSVVVGSANFPEDELLAEVYAQALQAKGIKVTTKLNIGAREVYYPQIKSGTISIIPEYNGELLSTSVDPSSTAKTTAEVDAALKAKLPSTLEILNPAPAADSDSVTVTQATATKYHLKSIADLAPYAKDMTFGGPPEFKTRVDGLNGLQKNYGLTFKAFDPLDESGPITLAALTGGKVQAADVFTTTPQIITDHLVPLADPKFNFAAQNVIPLVYKPAVNTTITTTLNAVSAKLTTEALLQMDNAVITQHADYSTVAAGFLKAEGLS